MLCVPCCSMPCHAKPCCAVPLSVQRVVHTEEEWKELLSPGQFYVLRQAGTELPRTRCESCCPRLCEVVRPHSSMTQHNTAHSTPLHDIHACPARALLVAGQPGFRCCHSVLPHAHEHASRLSIAARSTTRSGAASLCVRAAAPRCFPRKPSTTAARDGPHSTSHWTVGGLLSKTPLDFKIIDRVSVKLLVSSAAAAAVQTVRCACLCVSDDGY